MKFVLAPDKFKGSLTGAEFCDAVEEGILMVFPSAEILKKPLADGGDGTLEVVKDYLGAAVIEVEVHDPLFRKIKAPYLFSSERKTAFIEMSEASGHRLLKPNELNCMETSTLGTGELVLDALQRGAEEILLGIGGSATNDGGMGVAQALGYSFFDQKGQVLSAMGGNLAKVSTIQPPKESLVKGVTFKIACDVNNPFYGPNGAAYVYAGQKGASKAQMEQLDRGLKNFASVLQKTVGINLQEIQGSGAAGGLGGGAVAFLNGTLISGIDLIKELADFENALVNTDWIITGEGKLDHQTLAGKTIAGVLESAKNHNVPVAAFCGVVELSLKQQMELGITYANSILKNFQSLEEAMEHSYENLVFAAFNFAKT
ncbi:MAG: glycerate kinase, partial [Bacteroidota bacterium]